MLENVEFRDQWMRMLDAYYGLEHQFIEITRIIPVDNNLDVHSPILYSILQTSCGQIINMLRILCDRFELEHTSKAPFPELFNQIDITGVLERQIVYFSKTGTPYKPFYRKENEQTPFWWKAYNDTKHDLPEGFLDGNLRNTIFAMCGLFSIHNLAYYASHEHYVQLKEGQPISVPRTNLLCKSKWADDDSLSVNLRNQAGRNPSDERPESSIFFCMSKYHSGGADLG